MKGGKLQGDLLAWALPSAIGKPPSSFRLGICAFTAKPIVKTSLLGRRRSDYSQILKAQANHSEGLDETFRSQDVWNGELIDADHLLSAVKFNTAGLVPVITQQWDTGEVLMMAWMSRDAIIETMKGGRAVYYSRSRKQLWRKGDTSGQIQVVRDLLLDCDGDTILLKVDQLGVACHTGRRSCFFTAYRPPSGEPSIVAKVVMDPRELYKVDR